MLVARSLSRVQVLLRPSIQTIYKIKDLFESPPPSDPPPPYDPRKQPYDPENEDALCWVYHYIPDAFPNPSPSEEQIPLILPPFSGPSYKIWVGAPDIETAHKQIIMPEWRKWSPNTALIDASEYKKHFTYKIPHAAGTTEWSVSFKSYEADDQKWSMGAVDGMILTEGIPKPIFNEIRVRFSPFSFGSWDYTPYEPKNTGAKSALAYDCFRGKEKLPLRATIFSGFGVKNAPAHILAPSKKADMMRIYGGKAEGTARLEGNFFTDSPLILKDLDRPFHTLPITFNELNRLKPNLLLFRSIDPGYDHPTACAWMALSSANEWFVYRFYSKSGTTIDQRCENIIALSNNLRRPFDPTRQSTINANKLDRFQEKIEREIRLDAPPVRGILNEFVTLQNLSPLLPQNLPAPAQTTISDNTRWQEYHGNPNSETYVATFLDYHTFKTDETTGKPLADRYRQAGIIVRPSPTTRPKDRCAAVNDALVKQAYLTHPLTKQTPGAKLYFLINEPGVAEALEMLEQLYWARKNDGTPKDEMQEDDDDEFDGLSYPICSTFRWSPITIPKIL